MSAIPLDSLSDAVRALQQVFDTAAPSGPRAAAEVAKVAAAKGFPDQDLAVAVWRHLEAQSAAVTQNVLARSVSEEKVSKALFFVLLDPEFAKTRRSERARELSSDFRTVLRALAQRLGVALAEIADVAEATGFGAPPFLTDLAQEFATWLKDARVRGEHG